VRGVPDEADGVGEVWGVGTTEGMREMRALTGPVPLSAVMTSVFHWLPIVRRKDEAMWGEYRTKRMVLEKYEELESLRG
jgi:hypothetical protein